MKTNRIIIILLLTATVNLVFPVKLVMIGFQDKDPKTEFITRAFVQFLRQNLEDAKFEFADDKAEGLDYELLKQKNFFLACKEYFESYENMYLDEAIYGSVNYKGKTFYMNIEVYSREKRKLVMKAELKGNKQALLAFFHQATKEIINSLGVEQNTKNIFPVDDDETMFYKYLKFSYESEKLFETDEPDKYYSLIDELEAIKDKFDDYPVFAQIYDEVTSQSEEFDKSGVLGKPCEFVSKAVSDKDSEIEKIARELLVNGYIFTFVNLEKKPADEDTPNLYNAIATYTLKLKKSYKNNLIKEIKKRKGNPYFTDMGRFFFSQSDKESKDFRDFILRQSVVLSLYDEKGELVAKSEYSIPKSDFSNGAFRHTKILPFPLTPRGPANAAFGITPSSKINFIFEDIKQSDLDRVVRSEIEILFE